jgi:hypothetical protein
MEITTKQDCSAIVLKGDLIDQLIASNCGSATLSATITIDYNCGQDSNEFTVFAEPRFRLGVTCLGYPCEYRTQSGVWPDSVITAILLADTTTIPLSYPYDMSSGAERTRLQNDLNALDQVRDSLVQEVLPGEYCIEFFDSTLQPVTVTTVTGSLSINQISCSNTDLHFNLGVLGDDACLIDTLRWTFTSAVGNEQFLATSSTVITTLSPNVQTLVDKLSTFDIDFTLTTGETFTCSFSFQNNTSAPALTCADVEVVVTNSDLVTAGNSEWTSIEDDCLLINAIGVGQAPLGSTDLAALTDGIYSITFALDNGGTISTESGCAFVDCVLRCNIAQALTCPDTDVNWRMEKALMYDGIKYNAECCRCCTAFELYCILRQSLEDKGKCKCC